MSERRGPGPNGGRHEKSVQFKQYELETWICFLLGCPVGSERIKGERISGLVHPNIITPFIRIGEITNPLIRSSLIRSLPTGHFLDVFVTFYPGIHHLTLNFQLSTSRQGPREGKWWKTRSYDVTILPPFGTKSPSLQKSSKYLVRIGSWTP